MATDRTPADPTPLRGLLGSAATRFGLDDALATGSLWKRWADVVGQDVAAHAQPTSLRGGVLRIRADSPVWAHEIGYLAEEIRRKANAALGRDAVTEVRVWNAPGGIPSPSAGTPRSSRSGVGRGPSGDAGDGRPGTPDLDPMEALDNARRAWLDRRREARERGH